MGVVDFLRSIFLGKEKIQTASGQNTLYEQICALAGVSKQTDPDRLSATLIEKDQRDVKTRVYEQSWEKTQLYPLVEFIEQNYAQIKAEMPDVLKKLSVPLYLFYIHAAQTAIQFQGTAIAKKFVILGIRYFQLAGESFSVNPGFRILFSYLNNDLQEFEKLTKNAIGTTWGWDGKNGYEREIVYGMHQLLKGRDYAEIMKDIRIRDQKKFVILEK